MKQELLESADDIMPASFAFGLLGSIMCGLGLWCGVILLMI